MTTDKSAKILLLGKTGTGKSSFINYFIGKDVAKTGVGKPVTQGYCIEYDYSNGKYPIKIFDNQGFEAKTAATQKAAIIKMVAEKNNSIDVFNWFHTIFYCTSAKSRFEDFEAEMIKDLSRTISQNIHIIMTNCDGFDRRTLDEKKDFIKRQLSVLGGNVHIFEVVSVNMKKRNGDIVVPRGKEEISASVFQLLWQDISNKISKEYAAELSHSLVDSINQMFDKSKKETARIFSLLGIIQALRDESFVNNRLDSLDPEFDEIIESCNNKYNNILKPVSDLFISYSGTVCDTSFADKAMLDYNSWFSDIDDIDGDALIEKRFSHLSSGELNNFWDFLCSMGEITTALPRINGALNEWRDKMIKKIPQESDIEKRTNDKLMKFLDNFCFK